MKVRLRTWMAGLAASGLLLALPAVSMAAGAQTMMVPTSGTLTACNGDTVALSGYVEVVVQQVTTQNGTENGVVSANTADIKGVDTVTGTQYVAPEHATKTSTFTTNGAGESTLVETANLISQGSSPNLVVNFLLHITVNANGTVTAYVDDLSTACNG